MKGAEVKTETSREDTFSSWPPEIAQACRRKELEIQNLKPREEAREDILSLTPPFYTQLVDIPIIHINQLFIIAII